MKPPTPAASPGDWQPHENSESMRVPGGFMPGDDTPPTFVPHPGDPAPAPGFPFAAPRRPRQPAQAANPSVTPVVAEESEVTFVGPVIQAGAVLKDRYALSRPLGKGGMGEVWLAEDPQFQRAVAVKFLLTPDVELRARFLREGRAMAKAAHRNILVVHDTGDLVGGGAAIPYLVMEHADGGSLDDRVKDGVPMSWQDAVAALVPVCDAVTALHRAGIVHRDIKPSNILVSRGTVKLADFGLAKSADGTAQLTQPGMATGTLTFAAPEQLRGETVVDVRTDVFALGATLAKLVLGRSLWQAGLFPPGTTESLQARVNIFAAGAGPLPEFPPSPVLPEAVKSVIRRAMQFQPGDRYQSAEEMKQALKACLAAPAGPGLKASGGKQSLAVGRLRRVAPLGPLPLTVVAGVLVALVGGLAAFLILRRPATNVAPLKKTPTDDVAAIGTDPADHTTRDPLPTDAHPVPSPPNSETVPPVVPPGTGKSISGTAVPPVATGEPLPANPVDDLPSIATIERLDIGGAARAVQWISPTTVAGVSMVKGKLALWRPIAGPDGNAGLLAEESLSLLPGAKPRTMYAACVSRDGGMVAVSYEDESAGHCVEWRRRTRLPFPKRWAGLPDPVVALHFAADDRTLLAGDVAGRTRLLPLDGQDEDAVRHIVDGGIVAVTGDPAHTFVASAGGGAGRGHYQLFDLLPNFNGRFQKREFRAEEMIRAVAFDREGRRFAYSIGGQEICVFSSAELFTPVATSTKFAGADVPFRQAIRTIDFSPDGRWMAAGSLCGRIGLWDTRSRKLLARLVGHESSDGDGEAAMVVSLQFSPDGKAVVSGGSDGKLRLWNLGM